MRLATLTVSLVLLANACTVRTPGGATTSAPAPSSTATSPPAPSSPSSEASSNTPAEVVGSWTWVTSSGGQTLAFAADGTYTSDTYVDAHPGESCGTEYLTRREGKAEFGDATLTLQPSASHRKKTDSCKDAVLSDDAIDDEDSAYTWRLETDASTGAKSLVLVGSDAYEATYHRD